MNEPREKFDDCESEMIGLRKDFHNGVKTIEFLIIALTLLCGLTMICCTLALIGLNDYRASKYQQYQSPPPAQTQTVQTISE